jgi:hypothetical protein
MFVREDGCIGEVDLNVEEKECEQVPGGVEMGKERMPGTRISVVPSLQGPGQWELAGFHGGWRDLPRKASV